MPVKETHVDFVYETDSSSDKRWVSGSRIFGLSVPFVRFIFLKLFLGYCLIVSRLLLGRSVRLATVRRSWCR